MQELRGTGVALVTPFNKDLSIDFDGLTRLVEHCIAGGVNYLVALGTTAESATLTDEEKKQLIAHIIKVTNKRLPIILGVGGNNTAAIVAELSSSSFEGLTAILSVSPAYNKPTQEGIYQHFAAIAQASPLPVILYNVPGRTGSNMLPKTTARLASDFSNIVAIKEAVNDMSQVLHLLREVPDDFVVLSGDDTLALPLVTAGGMGVISVIGQGLPELFSQIMDDGLHSAFGSAEVYAERSRSAKAYKSHLSLLPLIDLIFEEGNPAGIKSLLAHQGICKSYVRLPLIPVSESLHQRIGQFLTIFQKR